MRETFVFYKSYYEAIKHLKNKDQLSAFRAIAEYGLNGEKMDISQEAAAVLEVVYPTIDKSVKRYNKCKENGAKGGRPKTGMV